MDFHRDVDVEVKIDTLVKMYFIKVLTSKGIKIWRIFDVNNMECKNRNR